MFNLAHKKDVPNNSALSNYYKSEHNILVSTKTGFQERKCTIKIDASIYNLKITLSDEADIFFLYSTNITHEDYLVIKNEQGLLINFPDFPEQICNLLNQCTTNKMHIQLVLSKPNLYYLEFVERNDFKNLMHLQLQMCPCESDEVMANITHKINQYKDKIANLEKKNELLNGEIGVLMKDNEKLCQSVNDVDVRIRMEYNGKLERKEDEFRVKCAEYESKLLQSHNLVQQNNSQIMDLTASQKVLQNQVGQYKQTIENMNKEIIKLENELKHIRCKNSKVDEEFRIKEAEIQTAKTNVAVLEQSLKEKIDIISMLKETLSRNDKEIEALRSASAMKSEQEMNTKLTLKQTTEDLNKANQIIATNTQNYDQLKKKMNVVSQILLKLEKDHTALQKEYAERERKFESVQQMLDTNQFEINRLEVENERLSRISKTKDENIAELRRLIEVQHKKIQSYEAKENAPIIPSLVSEWKPLPSPKEGVIASPLKPANQQLKTVMHPVHQKSHSARPAANKIDPKYPSSYFNPPSTSRNKTLSS